MMNHRFGPASERVVQENSRVKSNSVPDAFTGTSPRVRETVGGMYREQIYLESPVFGTGQGPMNAGRVGPERGPTGCVRPRNP